MLGGSDVQVQGTNDDASLSKRSCVEKGYFQDPFIGYFVPNKVVRSPLINRGYYSRFAVLRKLLLKFLQQTESCAKRNILSLGAGFDTSFWVL